MKLRIIVAVVLVLALAGLLVFSGQLRGNYRQAQEQYEHEYAQLEARGAELAAKEAELVGLTEAGGKKQDELNRMEQELEELTRQLLEAENEQTALTEQIMELNEALETLRNAEGEISDEAYYLEVYDALAEGLEKVKEYLAGN